VPQLRPTQSRMDHTNSPQNLGVKQVFVQALTQNRHIAAPSAIGRRIPDMSHPTVPTFTTSLCLTLTQNVKTSMNRLQASRWLPHCLLKHSAGYRSVHLEQTTKRAVQDPAQVTMQFELLHQWRTETRAYAADRTCFGALSCASRPVYWAVSGIHGNVIETVNSNAACRTNQLHT